MILFLKRFSRCGPELEPGLAHANTPLVSLEAGAGRTSSFGPPSVVSLSSPSLFLNVSSRDESCWSWYSHDDDAPDTDVVPSNVELAVLAVDVDASSARDDELMSLFSPLSSLELASRTHRSASDVSKPKPKTRLTSYLVDY